MGTINWDLASPDLYIGLLYYKVRVHTGTIYTHTNISSQLGNFSIFRLITFKARSDAIP